MDEILHFPPAAYVLAAVLLIYLISIANFLSFGEKLAVVIVVVVLFLAFVR